MDVDDVQGFHPDGYCGDLDCWCHTDVDYHDRLTRFDSEAEVGEGVTIANDFFGVAA